MSIDVGLEIQRQIFATLTGNAPLVASVTGIFDFVPQEQPFPFIKIGPADYTDLETQSTTGFEGTVTIDVWSRDLEIGTAPVHDILSQVRALLHNTDIWSITNFCMINFRENFRTVLVEPDTSTYHGVIRFTMTLGGNTSQ